jgi:Tfp pilus assembly protein PilO
MPEKNLRPSAKSKLKAPNTELSQYDDKSTSRYLFYMIAAMVVIVIAGGIAIYQLGRQYVTQSNKNKALAKTIGLLEQKKTDLAALKPNYEAITEKGPNGKSDADLILNAMPADEGYKQLIAMIERMGQEAGVQIPGVQKSTSGTAIASGGTSGATPYQISISMTGTFAQVMDFISKTENSSRVMDFSTLSFTGSTRGGTVQASATFTVFWQKPADIAPTEQELQ